MRRGLAILVLLVGLVSCDRDPAALSCVDDLEQIAALLRAGTGAPADPPARTLADLMERSAITVMGELVSAGGVEGAGGHTWIRATIAQQSVVHPRGHPIDLVDISTRSTAADAREIEGRFIRSTRFVAFLDDDPQAPGGRSYGTQGLVVGCPANDRTAAVMGELPEDVRFLPWSDLNDAVFRTASDLAD